ncbi:MAG: 3-oxoacyl-[acyl-carrier-protein] synthase III C-terminal domain-containing protein [Pseudomonadota bacterium]
MSTVVPDAKLPQDLVLDWARRTLGSRFAQFERMSKTFDNAGIESRYAVADISWFETPKSWPERNSVYLEGATQLFIRAATGALDDAGWEADDVDAIVTVSSTGIATPTLEARAHLELGFREDVTRIPVFGLGCAGGVSGLAIARDFAAAHEGTRVLMVAVEACTVSFCAGTPRKADIIGSAIFGDGAAAVCVTSENGGLNGFNGHNGYNGRSGQNGHNGHSARNGHNGSNGHAKINGSHGSKPQKGHNQHNGNKIFIGRGTQKMWPDTLSIMGWEVDEDSLGVVFDKSIPTFTEENFSSAVNGALAKLGKDISQIDRFVCHPGGTKVIQAIEQCLELQPDSLDEERDVLRNFGNMSAPTVLFVLQQVLEKEQTGDMLMCALGPGFTASFLPISRA